MAELQTRPVKTVFSLSNFIALILRSTSAAAEECLPRPLQSCLPSSCPASANNPKVLFVCSENNQARGLFFEPRGIFSRRGDISVCCTLSRAAKFGQILIPLVCLSDRRPVCWMQNECEFLDWGEVKCTCSFCTSKLDAVFKNGNNSSVIALET